MAMKTEIYRCPKCGSILVLAKDLLRECILCPTCKGLMTDLDDTFDSLEVIYEESK